MEVRAKIISKLDIIIPLFKESDDPMVIQVNSKLMNPEYLCKPYQSIVRCLFITNKLAAASSICTDDGNV